MKRFNRIAKAVAVFMLSAAFLVSFTACSNVIVDLRGILVDTLDIGGLTEDDTITLLSSDESLTLSAFISPDDATYGEVIWESSDPSVITVDSNGKITIVGPGSATITVTARNKTTTCTITVADSEIPVDSVAIGGLPESGIISLATGGSTIVKASVSPANATCGAVSWTSSDPSVATVDDSGKIIAIGPGTAIITLTAGGKTITCPVTVSAEPTPIDSVTIGGIPSGNAINLEKGGVLMLSSIVTPANATCGGVTWTSSDPSVVKVDSTGKVTAIGIGTATITVKVGKKTQKVTVTVPETSVPVETITITGISDDGTTTLEKGVSITLSVTITPEDATYSGIDWTSSDPTVATVDSTGKITAVGKGTTTITVKIGDKTESVTITVTETTVSVQDITITGIPDDGKVTLAEGETKTVSVTVTPEDATYSGIDWTSSDPTVATIDDTGKITAVGPGTTTITIKAGDVTKTFTVTVTDEAASSGQVTFTVTVDDTASDISVTNDTTAKKLTVASDYDSYQWYVDGTAESGATTATYDYSALTISGTYNITVEAKKNSSIYSATVYVKVE